MTKQAEAMKLALEALTHLQPTALASFYTIGDRDKAITALREALASEAKEQPAPVAKPHEQEPVAWDNCRSEKQCRSWCGNSACASHWNDTSPPASKP